MNDIIVYPLQFVEKKCEYESIYTFRFTSEQPISFVAGQWVHLGFPSEQKDKSKVRHLSISSAPNEPYYEFTMDVNSDSWYKKQMKALTPGDVMRAFKIKGEFVVPPTLQRPVVFIVGGIGITPIRSIVRDIEYKKENINWSLLHVSRTQFLFEEELAKSSKKQWRVHRDGLDDVWSDVISNGNEALYYLCGSDRFVEGMKEKLGFSDITPDNIVVENFNH